MRRQNDNALLRKDIAVFAGFSENLPANQFGVTSAEAVASNQLKVVFSENLSAPTVDVADFGLQGFNITNLTIPYEGAYDKVLLNLDNDLSTGQYYVLTVNNLNNLDAYSGNTLGNENATVFVGYGASEDRSNLALTSATVNSETQVTLSFNQAPLASTIIPVNFAIKPNLTITNVIVSGNNVVLTTSVQDEGVSYTVIAKADKIKDQDQLLISSQNTTTFTGYKSLKPVLDSVTPNQVVNDVENEISLSGTNFETGTEVYLNTLKLTSTLTTTMIQAKVPFEQDAGVYDLILKRPNGEQIKLENALVVENPVQNIEVLTAESYASPKLVPNDGATPTTFWVRISDPKGVSDIDSVTMDLRPIDGSPAQIMQPEGIVDNKRWYSLELTVPNTVSTSAVPIALEVVAQNKAGDRAYGTVTLTVNNDLTSSIPPVVEKAYATPDALSPGSDDDIYFYAYVRDDDGANTLHNVTINL